MYPFIKNIFTVGKGGKGDEGQRGVTNSQLIITMITIRRKITKEWFTEVSVHSLRIRSRNIFSRAGFEPLRSLELSKQQIFDFSQNVVIC